MATELAWCGVKTTQNELPGPSRFPWMSRFPSIYVILAALIRSSRPRSISAGRVSEAGWGLGAKDDRPEAKSQAQSGTRAVGERKHLMWGRTSSCFVGFVEVAEAHPLNAQTRNFKNKIHPTTMQ